MKQLPLNLFLVFCACSVFAQTPAFDENARLGRGINLGNMFEAPSETAWGNPFQDDYIERIANLGFGHIRVPIRWEPADRSSATPPYTINATFLARIQHVVDLALRHHLQVIINMHHHEAMMDDPDGQKERFISMWKQLTQYFSGYSDSLVFELLNEPHGNLTAEKWNDILADGIQAIRETDSSRFILVGVAEYGGLGGLSKLKLPDDDRLILTIHYYNPFHFTHQGAEWAGSEADQWLGTEWNDTESERQAVESDFAAAIQYSKDHNIPIHVGEFGAYSKADLASRARWTTYLPRYFESQNFSWAYWEFSAGFGIYNPKTQTYVPELVDALLHSPMPEPTPVIRKEIKKTDFEKDGDQQGWNLYQNGGASASGTVTGGAYEISIKNGGTESWSVQMVLNNIMLQQGVTYEINLRAKAADSRSVIVYAGMNQNPWSPYSGYSSFALTNNYQTLSLNFQMQNTTDTNARLVLDLGNSEADVSIDEITLNQVSLGTNLAEIEQSQPYLYPNPTHGIIHFSGIENNSQVNIYTMNGKLYLQSFTTNNNTVNIQSLPPGQYLIQLGNNIKQQATPIVKL